MKKYSVTYKDFEGHTCCMEFSSSNVITLTNELNEGDELNTYELLNIQSIILIQK